MRSLTTQLRCAVLSVLVQQDGFSRLTDDDFAFLDAVQCYAKARTSSEPSNPSLFDTDTTQNGYGNASEAPREPLRTSADDAPGSTTGVAPLTQPTVDPGAEHDDSQVLTFDRGPEPQDTAEMLDTAPADDDSAYTNASDPRDIPPDYTKLPSVKGS